MKHLDYNLALEKAVLEFAKSAGARPHENGTSRARIPGWMEGHVWAMATQLSDQGYVVAYVPADNKGIGVSNINESGSLRLKELVAVAEKEAEAARIRAKEGEERAYQNKWWRRIVRRPNAAV